MPIGMSADDARVYARYSQLGFEMIAPILLGLGADWWLRISPWGVCVGAVFSLIYMVFRLQRLAKAEEAPATESGTPERRP